MRLCKKLACVIACLVLTACGTYVPEIQEIGDDAQGEILVKAIVGSIRCEIRNAVHKVVKADLNAAEANKGVVYAKFLDNWGTQVGLTLQIDEKTSFNPTAVWLPPAAASVVFTLGGSLNVSSQATRISKLNYYYTVKELKDQGPCPSDYNAHQPHVPGSLLIQSDLKLAEWLSDAVTLAALGQIGVPTGPGTPLKQNAFSQEVKFDVISSGSVTPAWKLRRFNINQSGSLVGISRERVHDLIVTFGPIDPTLKDTLAPTAQALFISSQLGTTFSNTARGTLP